MNSVIYTGFWLHSSGVLGASPDGIVKRTPKCPPTMLHGVRSSVPGLIEVKCPYSAREMTISEAANQLKGFFLGMYFKPDIKGLSKFPLSLYKTSDRFEMVKLCIGSMSYVSMLLTLKLD